MQYYQGIYALEQVERLTPTAFGLWVACPDVAAIAAPGQFVNILVPGFFLRRPISICEIDRAGGRLRLVFEVKGGGTAALAQLRPGDSIDLLAPLGSGFFVNPAKHPVLVGGGIGAPPMLELAKRYGKAAAVVNGFRTAAQAILTDDFARYAGEVTLCTDDGSAGVKGLVTGPLEALLQSGGRDIVYACGPLPMLKAVAALAARYRIRCQVSMEERMACGVGACLGCACRTRKPGGGGAYTHVCTNGPVFEADKILWDEL